MIINHNISALNTHRQLGANNNAVQGSLEKLSSGLQINRAGDDAAGLAISEKMRGQIRGLDMAAKNAQDGISLIQTAEGALNETHDILQRMRELAVQSSNDTNTDADRAELQNEVDALAKELTRISDNTEFNTQNLLDGKFEATFHIGANENQNLAISVDNMGAAALGVQNDTSGLQLEVSTDVSSSDLQATESVSNDTSYDVVKLDETVTVGGAEYNYTMQDDEGQVVGVSENGQEWSIAESAVSLEDIGSISFDAGATGIDLGNKVVSGQITVSNLDNGSGTTDGAITLTGTATAEFADGSKGLTSGEYTVVDDSNVFVSGSNTVGLTNAKGDLVAVSTNGEAWKDLNGEDLFTLDTNNAIVAAKAGETFTVAGEGGIDISSQAAADKAITTIQDAVDTVSSQRSALGAVQNRLEHTINNLGASSENLTAAESRIRDVDHTEAA